MAGRMTEEIITRTILNWLKIDGWLILSFDYPQSGTGYALRPDGDGLKGSKNLGTLIPDVIAVKNEVTIFFENKVFFFQGDIDALLSLREDAAYAPAIRTLHQNQPTHRSMVGVGLLHTPSNIEKLFNVEQFLDFAVAIGPNSNVKVLLDRNAIFGAKSRFWRPM